MAGVVRVDVTDPVGVVVPELSLEVDQRETGYWNREPLRSLGEGEMDALDAGEVTPQRVVVPLVATLVGITTLVGVFGV